MSRLSQKRCVVTGAARSIGLAIAEAFVAEGALVVATARDEDDGRPMAARWPPRSAVSSFASTSAWKQTGRCWRARFPPQTFQQAEPGQEQPVGGAEDPKFYRTCTQPRKASKPSMSLAFLSKEANGN